MGKNVLMETVVSKTVYKELRNRIITPPTAQLNYIIDDLEWKEIYSFPFRTGSKISLKPTPSASCTLHVEKTATKLSNSNSSLATFTRSTHG